MPTIKTIKKTAKVNLVIGTGFMNSIQKALIQIGSDKTKEELEIMNNVLKDTPEGATPNFPEPWMDTMYTISLLITNIENQIIETNQFEEKEVEDFIKEQASNQQPDQE